MVHTRRAGSSEQPPAEPQRTASSPADNEPLKPVGYSGSANTDAFLRRVITMLGIYFKMSQP